MRHHLCTRRADRKGERINGMRRLGKWSYRVFLTERGPVGVFGSLSERPHIVWPTARDERLRREALRGLGVGDRR